MNAVEEVFVLADQAEAENVLRCRALRTWAPVVIEARIAATAHARLAAAVARCLPDHPRRDDP